MNAADVLRECYNLPYPLDAVAALLAHGEQGVAILPDGTLWALEFRQASASSSGEPLYRLVPLSAEAGDTESKLTADEQGIVDFWRRPAGWGESRDAGVDDLLAIIDRLSAEAGDTDA